VRIRSSRSGETPHGSTSVPHVAHQAVSQDTLREVTETLARIERSACSPGEWEAALWLEQRLKSAGCHEVALEEEPSWGPWPPTVTGLSALGTIAGRLVLRGRRGIGAMAAVAALAGIIDEIQNGPRLLRRAVRRRRVTVNVVARAGDPDAENTLVVLAHHDAAQTGLIFDQRLARAVYERAPALTERQKDAPPVWWPMVGGPLLALAGAVTGRRALARAGFALSLVSTAFVADILRSPTVPGANDNLSGVAGLVALAELLTAKPIPGLRVLLVSCGAEETFQDGIRAFTARHRDELPTERTWFLNLDTIGSPHLVMLEGEGPVWMEEYADPSFRELVASCAKGAGIALESGVRTHASTDGIIPSRESYPTASLISFEPWRLPTNYHLMSDVPESLHYGTIADAVALAHAVGGSLARA
jgi:Zn-dependent M28 family amino/carboxypeptidase